MRRERVEPFEIYSIRPERDVVIQKDEILSLKIDLEVLTPEELFLKYFGCEAE
jgi:hypothetical protein